MKSPLNLRHVRVADYQRRHAVACWQRDGYDARLCLPPTGVRYISFSGQGAQGVWQGMMNAQQWLQNVWPQRSQLLPQGCSDDEALELFSVVSRPLEVAEQLFDYQRLFQFELVDGQTLQQIERPCITTPQGDLWLVALPNQPREISRPLQSWVYRVPQVLRVVIGCTHLAAPRCQRLSPGDVLFIAEQARQLFLADHYIGQFTFIEEGLHMELTTPQVAVSPMTCALSPLPVKLEFVLAEQTLSMGELNELIEQQILPLALQATHEIEIRAGGKRIAVGELVQLDDRLGVELREVYRGDNDE